ncbi:MAG: low molecular weight protein-tyrosine phosphatase [Actinomycetota bacterium]|nr:low molecular weight protein-tyrosine phosphatase [Actinomycetota bacterium]
MRSALPDGIPVTSAGTRARRGEPIWPEAGEELERRGVCSLGFSSYPIDSPLVHGADLVLAATRAHRDEIVAAFPGARGHVFTWRELAWLTGGILSADIPGASPGERLTALAPLVSGRRGRLRPPPPEMFDVADPVDGPRGAVTAAADEIERALGPVVALLS